MKFYLLTYLILALFINTSLAQNIPQDEDKSELPQLSTESLQIKTEVELYPNPVIDQLNIQLKNSKLKNVQFEIYNIIGNKMNFELEAVSNNNYRINVKEFHSGYYLLIVKDQVTRYNKAFKFRKQ